MSILVYYNDKVIKYLDTQPVKTTKVTLKCNEKIMASDVRLVGANTSERVEIKYNGKTIKNATGENNIVLPCKDMYMKSDLEITLYKKLFPPIVTLDGAYITVSPNPNNSEVSGTVGYDIFVDEVRKLRGGATTVGVNQLLGTSYSAGKHTVTARSVYTKNEAYNSVFYIPYIAVYVGSPGLKFATQEDYAVCRGAEENNITDLVIPTAYENLPVKIIKMDAFRNNDIITSVTMSDSVEHIDEYAFSNNYNLTDVRLSNNLKKIGSCAFKGCKDLFEVTIPDGAFVSINDGAFGYCTSLIRFTLGKDVTYLGERVFLNCTNLTKISYGGTCEQFIALQKHADWKSSSSIKKIICTNGEFNFD